MSSLSRAAAAALLAVALAAPSWAGQVKLEIRGGLVTLSAKDATVREILAEWARVGHTRIVNGERVPGGLVNVELTDVPEAKALDIVLRSVAGYVAAPRPTASTQAGSRFDRIMVMAVARPPAGGSSPASPVSTNPAPPGYEPRGRPGGFQPAQPQPQPSLMVDDQDEPVQPQPQPQMGMPSMTGAPGAAQPGMQTPAPMPVNPGQTMPVAPGQVPQATPNPPGQQPNSPAAQRPGVMTPSPANPANPRPPGTPDGPGN